MNFLVDLLPRHRLVTLKVFHTTMGRQVVISFATTPIPLAVSRIVSWPLTPWRVSGFRLGSHMLLDFLRERLLIKDMVVS